MRERAKGPAETRDDGQDIEYRHDPESSDWIIVTLGASARDVQRALSENERLGWDKYRVTQSITEEDEDV